MQNHLHEADAEGGHLIFRRGTSGSHSGPYPLSFSERRLLQDPEETQGWVLGLAVLSPTSKLRCQAHLVMGRE